MILQKIKFVTVRYDYFADCITGILKFCVERRFSVCHMYFFKKWFVEHMETVNCFQHSECA